MTRRVDPEIRWLRMAGVALVRLPKDAQFRALAYLVARTANVGRCEASEWLYACARREREAAAQHAGKEGSDG